jgi:hypothetical protein
MAKNKNVKNGKRKDERLEQLNSQVVTVSVGKPWDDRETPKERLFRRKALTTVSVFFAAVAVGSLVYAVYHSDDELVRIVISAILTGAIGIGGWFAATR